MAGNVMTADEGRERMRVLVCGGRGLDATDVFNWLERNAYDYIADATGQNSPELTTLIHGGARGADKGAARWGQSEHLKVVAYPANWRKYGKAAGPIRNQKMIDEGKPDIVIAFPGGRGTADCVERAQAASTKVIEAIRAKASARSSAGRAAGF